MIRSNDYANSNNNYATAGATKTSSDVLSDTMLGLEEFGHSIFTAPEWPQQRQPLPATDRKQPVEIHNSKGRELVQTMRALEELGFHIFTAPGGI